MAERWNQADFGQADAVPIEHNDHRCAVSRDPFAVLLAAFGMRLSGDDAGARRHQLYAVSYRG